MADFHVQALILKYTSNLVQWSDIELEVSFQRRSEEGKIRYNPEEVSYLDGK